jgi:hypothetical protein
MDLLVLKACKLIKDEKPKQTLFSIYAIPSVFQLDDISNIEARLNTQERLTFVCTFYESQWEYEKALMSYITSLPTAKLTARIKDNAALPHLSKAFDFNIMVFEMAYSKQKYHEQKYPGGWEKATLHAKETRENLRLVHLNVAHLRSRIHNAASHDKLDLDTLNALRDRMMALAIPFDAVCDALGVDREILIYGPDRPWW